MEEPHNDKTFNYRSLIMIELIIAVHLIVLLESYDIIYAAR